MKPAEEVSPERTEAADVIKAMTRLKQKSDIVEHTKRVRNETSNAFLRKKIL